MMTFAMLFIIILSRNFLYKNDKSKEYLEILEPEAQKINTIRNHLEHKFINIQRLDIETKLENDNELNIFVSDLEEKTVYLAKLAREAIIYLSFTIHQEELKKETLI